MYLLRKNEGNFYDLKVKKKFYYNSEAGNYRPSRVGQGFTPAATLHIIQAAAPPISVFLCHPECSGAESKDLDAECSTQSRSFDCVLRTPLRMTGFEDWFVPSPVLRTTSPISKPKRRPNKHLGRGLGTARNCQKMPLPAFSLIHRFTAFPGEVARR